jgi:glycosyltransferase involved in cell wall biosynthesis
LPYLSRHFDIDIYIDDYKITDEAINSAFRIFNAKDFEAVASKYDAILYEFGNSEYHEYMLPILKRYPGIVGLHDAYLSGLFGYLEFYQGQNGSFSNEMLYSHGPLARRLLAPIQNHIDPVGVAHSELPCTKGIIDNAIGIISHSPFNLEVARLNYPEGWQSPYRTIPQMVSVIQPWNEVRKEVARKDLGFASDDFIITAFGHVVWTKWGDRLLDAFLNSILCDKERVYLVFAGEIAKDDFGLKLMQTIEKSGVKDRIRVTGFLSAKDYERYLRISDVAIQLRTKSRGGTPKGVLDCLAHGLAVIVNNDASYKDYPKDVVIKLSAEPPVTEIAFMLEKVFFDPAYRMPFSCAGLEYVRSHHDPVLCAGAYAAAIHEFVERNAQLEQPKLIAEFAPHIAGCDDPERTSLEVANWINAIPLPNFSKQKIYIDVSHIAEFDHKTGIQRVVKEIVHYFYCSSAYGFEPIAVKLEGDNLVVASDWLESRGLALPSEKIGKAGLNSTLISYIWEKYGA